MYVWVASFMQPEKWGKQTRKSQQRIARGTKCSTLRMIMIQAGTTHNTYVHDSGLMVFFRYPCFFFYLITHQIVFHHETADITKKREHASCLRVLSPSPPPATSTCTHDHSRDSRAKLLQLLCVRSNGTAAVRLYTKYSKSV